MEVLLGKGKGSQKRHINKGRHRAPKTNRNSSEFLEWPTGKVHFQVLYFQTNRDTKLHDYGKVLNH